MLQLSVKLYTLIECEASVSKRIVLIHATPVAMQPVIEAFRLGWSEAETVNLLEDSLSADLASAGKLDQAMIQRFARLGDYGISIGADGILFTCSAFGAAIDAVAQTAPIPVLKPNQAMFEAALQSGRTAGLLATFQPSVPSMQQEFLDLAKAQGKDVALETVWVPHAMGALAAGDTATHDRLLAEATPRLAHCDVIMLAQFSMARALPVVRQAVHNNILTSPDSAVAKLKAALNGR
jgi:aspartate/glutamate racemase